MIPKEGHPHVLTGEHLPVTLGHEFCGRVSSLSGDGISADGSSLKVGQPVMVDPRLNCQSCFSCKAGGSNLCGKWGFIGLNGNGGGFSEAVAVRSDMCYPLPEDMPLDQAVLIEPLAVGRHAIVKSGVPMDKLKDHSILIIGGGPVGLSVAVNLSALGAKEVYVSEPAAQRQALIKPYVAKVFNPMEQRAADECRKVTDGKGVDLVFDCAGIPPGMRNGFNALRPMGTYVNVAGWESDFVIPFGEFMGKEIVIRCTLAYDDKDFGDVVRDFVAGELLRIRMALVAE